MDKSTKGTLGATGAFFIWGILPIYWKALQHVSSTQILAHRVLWCLVVVIVLLSAEGRWKETKHILSSYLDAGVFLVTSFLLGGNWLIYVWAINSNQIVEASLGYFINPLLNVCLGIVFLRERLSRSQAFSLLLAFIGVLYLSLQYGRIPWIAISLALTFGAYGILRKTAKAGSMVGLLFDVGFLAPIFLVYLIILGTHGSGAFTSVDAKTDILLLGTGVVTAAPLLLFAYGARRIKYATLGFLQYIAPTGQLLVGVVLYKEPFTRIHGIAFALVWAALAIYSIASFTVYKRELSL